MTGVTASKSYNARMGSLGVPELLVILGIALLIFGPRKLPDVARGMGHAIRGFKQALDEGERGDEPKPPESKR